MHRSVRFALLIPSAIALAAGCSARTSLPNVPYAPTQPQVTAKQHSANVVDQALRR